jgi:nucleoside-diphosphate-sugar epimerase
MTDKKILVTGVTGYLASWIVKDLLAKGFTVHGTVRNLKDEKKIAHLKKIEASTKGKLNLFESDLLLDGSFEKAMKDCSIVVHTASPFKVSGVKDPVNELIKPALNGTRNVLEQVNKTQSVERVVLTSSVVAIYGDSCELKEANVEFFDETMWNSTSNENHQPYPYSKTIAEKEAWKIHDAQDRWSMAVMNPGFIMGPSLTPYTQSTSFEIMSGMGKGEFKMGVPALHFGIVDVRDVADAHVKSAIDNSVGGRNILVNTSMDMLDMSYVLQKNIRGKNYPFPKSRLPKFLIWLVGPSQGFSRTFVKKNVGIPIKFNNEKSIRDICVSYRPVEDTIAEHFKQLIDDELI